jgi:hypothetical protein
MVTKDRIIKFNFKKSSDNIEVLYQFKNKLTAQPENFDFDVEQKYAIIATEDDALWVSIQDSFEVDIDQKFEFADIKCLFCFNQKFYILANKVEKKLGYYLLMMDVDIGSPTATFQFLIKWVNKLNIGNAEIEILYEKINHKGRFLRNLV